MVSCRILIVDNNEQFRSTLARSLRLEVDFAVVGEVSVGDEAVHLAARLTPDVILLDVELPEMDAPSCIIAMQQRIPTARIVALSIVPDRRYQEMCRQAGSHAYLPKDSPLSVIVAAIRDGESDQFGGRAPQL
jgi:DNA-binding NarL/FixJ family response regulator